MLNEIVVWDSDKSLKQKKLFQKQSEGLFLLKVVTRVLIYKTFEAPKHVIAI